MRRTLTLAGLAGSLLAAGSASAAIVASADFDAVDPNYTYTFGYAGYGQGGSNFDISGQVTAPGGDTPAVGVGGTSALQVVGDASGVVYPTPRDYDYWGFGAGAGLTNGLPSMPAGLPSPNVADYTFSFDVRGTGFNTASTQLAEVDLRFDVPDDTFGVDGGTEDDVALTLRFANVPVTGSFATFTNTLDNAVVQSGSLANFVALFSQVTNISINFNTAGGDWGLDAGNTLIIDNIVLDAVPEPSTWAALAGAGALAVAALRRRR